MWNRELADACRNAAPKVRHGKYDWSDMSRCNCGILARELTGTGYEVTWKLLDHPLLGHTWGQIGHMMTCELTGLPVNALTARLLEAGLEPNDLDDLENLRNNEIRLFAGLPPFSLQNHDYDHRPSVAKYLIGWAKLIDSQLGPRPDVPVEVVPQRSTHGLRATVP